MPFEGEVLIAVCQASRESVPQVGHPDIEGVFNSQCSSWRWEPTAAPQSCYGGAASGGARGGGVSTCSILRNVPFLIFL